jgi:hypothetical protein
MIRHSSLASATVATTDLPTIFPKARRNGHDGQVPEIQPIPGRVLGFFGQVF